MKSSISDIDVSFSFGGGASLCYYFNQHVGQNSGIAVDVLYGGINQKYSGTVLNQGYTSEVHLRNIEFPVYARFGTQSGAYFELGVHSSILLSATYISNNALSAMDSQKDIQSNTSTFSIGPLLGFGIDIPIGEDLYITTGLRFTYSLIDAKGVDPYGRDATLPSLYDKSMVPPSPEDKQYDSKKGTHPAMATLMLGVYYRFDVGAYGHVK